MTLRNSCRLQLLTDYIWILRILTCNLDPLITSRYWIQVDTSLWKHYRSWLLLIGYTVNYWDEPISERLYGFCTIFVIEAILFVFFTVYFPSPRFVILLKGPKCDRIYAYLCSFPVMSFASLSDLFLMLY